MSGEPSRIDDEDLSDLDSIRDAIRIEQGQSRRVMLWFITVFIFILLVVLALFLVAGIFIMRNSRQVVAAVQNVESMVTVNEFNISNFTNQLTEIKNTQMQLSAKINATGTTQSREFGKLAAEQRRHSKWIEVKDSGYERDKRNVNERILNLGEDSAGNSRKLEGLLKKIDQFVSVGNVVVVPGIAPDEGKEAAISAKTETLETKTSDEVSVEVVNEMFAKALAGIIVPEREIVSPETISVVTFPNGDRYEGEFSNGLMHGWGAYTCKDGSRYEGNFEKDLKQGYGTLSTTDGKRYVGEFKNGMKHGKGSLTSADGTRYVGDFNNDLITGRGVMFLGNGDKYAGDIVNGLRHGNGVLRFSNGDIYDGEFRDGIRTGSGTYVFADGIRYIGGFVDGVRQGMGRYIYPSGAEYVGPFVDGNKHGEGVRVYPNGMRRKGLWRDDKFLRDIQE